MAHPVDVVIPHYIGREKLFKCLETLLKTDYDNFRVILVDNGSADGSCDEAKRLFPEIELVRLPKNLGFAGGCNAGVRHGTSEFVALLNDDTEVEPEWLGYLVEAIASDERVAAVQPKLRWILDRSKFDYAGAAGGLMDIFGYPFCYGRLFETIETDNGQYDWVRDIFWATGSATIYRRSLFLKAGGLDECFFAHQEEIDLNWRFHLMGHRIIAEMRSVVYHHAGATLPASDFRKKYLNHRNSIMMMVKNYQPGTLLWVMPLKIALEMCAVVLAVKQRDYKRILAIFRAGLWNLANLSRLVRARRQVRRLRTLPDREIIKKLYRGSVALQYYLFGKRDYYQLARGGGEGV